MPAQARLLPGFDDPSAGCQAVFRTLLKAMSRPGMRLQCPAACQAPAPLAPATAAAALCLLDQDTTIWLDETFGVEVVVSFLQFHAAAPVHATPDQADFVLIGDPAAMLSLDRFRLGSVMSPEQSATLIIQVPSLESGAPVELCGPGIEKRITIRPAGLPAWFWEAWRSNHNRFPLGVDVMFTQGQSYVGLPRTAEVTACR